MEMFNESGRSVKATIPLRYHIIFWIVYFVFNFIRWGSYFDDYVHSFKSNLIEFPLHIIIVYYNIYYLAPKYIVGKKYKTYVALLSLALAINYCARVGLVHWLIPADSLQNGQMAYEPFSFNHIVAITLGEIYVIGLVSAIKFTIDYVIELSKNHRLLELQMETEMKYLKAQIQPHFFFNVLNSLYAFTLKRSEKAAEIVLKLSEIMEYMIYDLNKKEIALPKEIKYVRNYIELEKIRKKGAVEAKLDIIGEIDDVVLPPFLFLPLVENCFKHGLLKNGEIHLEMKLERTGDILEFSLKNRYEPGYCSQIKSGIGLKNLRRRLELLYTNGFSLDTGPLEKYYLAYLKIPLI